MALSLQNPKVSVSVVFVAAMFMNILDTTIVNTAIPAIGRQFDASVSSTGAVASAYLVSLAVVIPASGWLGDRFGTRRIFLVALALFTLASGLCGLASSLGQLIGFRVLQGVGGGMMTPVGMAMLFRVFPQNERVRASRILVLPTALAPALGPVLGGLFVDHLSWHWAFIVNVPIGLAALVFGAMYLPESEKGERGRFDALGFVLAGVGLGSLMYAVSEGPVRGWGTVGIVAPGILGVVLLVALVVHELRTAAPLLHLRLLRDRIFSSSILIMIPATAGFLGFLYAFPLLQQEGLGRSASTSGFLTFPEAIGVMVGSQIISRLYPVVGPRRLMAVGAAVVAALAAFLSTIDGGTPDAVVVVAMFFLGLAMSSVFIPQQSAAFANISARETGQASGLFNALRQTGAAVGVATLATVIAVIGPLESSGGAGAPVPNLTAYHAAFLVSAGLLVVAALMALRIRDSDAASTMGTRDDAGAAAATQPSAPQAPDRPGPASRSGEERA
ncbi:MDR family MFS transporter [Patulibacter americanus]|uniref:MDR family MFS transporter n=1 Tax=Patulibacter americanus TaxID=588672 RepID=UPI0003B3CBE6|nr:MDR family MFS transporter [Patulibacter americanus]